MGDLFQGSTNVQTFDPNPRVVKPGQQAASNSLLNFFGTPAGSGNPFLQLLNATPQGRAAQQGVSPVMSPLAGAAGAHMLGGLGGFQPETFAFNQVQGALTPMLSGMGELQNPFGDLGAVNRGLDVIQAARPIAAQNFQDAQARLSQAAPSRFSSAFAREGLDLGSQALRDFNLFQAQTLQQGLQQQLAERSQALNFALGARGLSQQGQLGAGSLIGQLAGQAGMNPFQRQLGAGQFGLQQANQQFGQGFANQQLMQNLFLQGLVNPTSQLFGQGLDFLNPLGLQAIVQQDPSVMQQILGPLAAGAGLAIAGSSLAFKEDVSDDVDTQDALREVRDLRLYRWRYKGDPKRRLGPIVEDPTTPAHFVTPDGSHLDLYEMLTTLTAAVQALAERVAALEA